jgi:hypothetical protein
MKKIAIVYVARDDKYGDDYNVVDMPSRDSIDFKTKYVIKYNNIQRIKCALEKNIELLDKYFKDDYEIIMVDWSPINNQYLYKNDVLKGILQNNNVKNIIINKEIIEKNGLNPTRFYEYFGKNIGSRFANSEYILISNPDDILSEELVVAMSIQDYDNNHYYRCYSRLDVDHELNVIDVGLCFPKNGNIIDEVMGSPASGDFILVSKKTFFDMKGFCETKNNNNGNEAYCDGQLIIKMYNNNIMPVILNGSILHLDHKKHDRSGGSGYHWINDYTNDDTWGFNLFVIKNIYDNIFVMY